MFPILNPQPLVFSPRNYASLALWLDGNDPAGNGVQPADGSALTTWVDKSLNGNDATQTTGAKKFLFQLNQVNSLAAVSADGINDTMEYGLNSFPSASDGRSVYCVFKSNNVSNIQYPLSFGEFTPANSFTTGVYNSNLICDLQNAYAHGDTTLSSSVVYILEQHYTAGSLLSTLSQLVNGVAQSNTVVGTDATLDTTLTSGWMGSSFDNFAYADGLICEALVFNETLLAYQQTRIRQYLSDRWR